MKEKNIGIWMDHSNAFIIEFGKTHSETIVIESKFTQEERTLSLNHGESRMHAKEQHFQADYFKEISLVISGCSEVLLFGPTDAKMELYNLLKENHHFDKVKIDVKQSDKITENQKHVFVKNYFFKK